MDSHRWGKALLRCRLFCYVGLDHRAISWLSSFSILLAPECLPWFQIFTPRLIVLLQICSILEIKLDETKTPPEWLRDRNIHKSLLVFFGSTGCAVDFCSHHWNKLDVLRDTVLPMNHELDVQSLVNDFGGKPGDNDCWMEDIFRGQN